MIIESLYELDNIAICCYMVSTYWLVVSTPLKNIRQLGWFSPIYRKKIQLLQITNQTILVCPKTTYTHNPWKPGHNIISLETRAYNIISLETRA
jgi:hypothetical protein